MKAIKRWQDRQRERHGKNDPLVTIAIAALWVASVAFFLTASSDSWWAAGAIGVIVGWAIVGLYGAWVAIRAVVRK